MNDREYEFMLAEFDNLFQDRRTHGNNQNTNHFSEQSPRRNLENEKMKPTPGSDSPELSKKQPDFGNPRFGIGKEYDDHTGERIKTNQTDNSQQIHLTSEPKESTNMLVNKSWKNLLNESQEDSKVADNRKGPDLVSSYPTSLYAKNIVKENQNVYKKKINLDSKSQQKTSNIRALRDEPEEDGVEFIGSKSKQNIRSLTVNYHEPLKKNIEVTPNKHSPLVSSSPKKGKEAAFVNMKDPQSAKANNFGKTQVKDPFSKVDAKSSKQAQKNFLLKGKQEQKKAQFKNLSPQRRGVYRHYTMPRRKRGREEDLEIYERCDAYGYDVRADPEDYEIVIVTDKKIKPEEESDEDEISNFDYIEMDKQFDPIAEVIEGPPPKPVERAEKNNPEGEPALEKMPEERLAKQGVYVDMTVKNLDPRTVRLSYIYRGINEKNIARKNKLRFGNSATKQTVKLDAFDLIFPNFYQRDFQKEGVISQKSPKRNALPPVKHPRRLAYLARQKKKILDESPRKKEITNPLLNTSEAKHNTLVKESPKMTSVNSKKKGPEKADKRAEIIEKKWEYNFHHSKKFPPPRIQRSRSLTALEIVQYMKKLNSKRYGVESKIDTGKQSKWKEQRRYSLNFVKMNKESLKKMNHAEQYPFEEVRKDSLRKAHSAYYKNKNYEKTIRDGLNSERGQRQNIQRSPFVVSRVARNNLDLLVSLERLKRLFPKPQDLPIKPILKRSKSSGRLEPLNHKNASLKEVQNISDSPAPRGVQFRELNRLMAPKEDPLEWKNSLKSNLLGFNYQSTDHKSLDKLPLESRNANFNSRDERSKSTELLQMRKDNIDKMLSNNKNSQELTWIASNINPGSSKQILNLNPLTESGNNHLSVHPENQQYGSSKNLSSGLQPKIQRSRSRESIEKASLLKKIANKINQDQTSEWIASNVNSTELKSLSVSPKHTYSSKASAGRYNEHNNDSLSHLMIGRTQELTVKRTLQRSHSSDRIRARAIKPQNSPDWIASRLNTKVLDLPAAPSEFKHQRRSHRKTSASKPAYDIFIPSQSYSSSPKKLRTSTDEGTKRSIMAEDAQTSYLLKKSAELSAFRLPSLSRQILNQQ